jgi:putative redox protein
MGVDVKTKKLEPEMASSSSTVNIRWINSTSTLMAGIDSRGTSAVIGIWSEHEPLWRGLKASDLLLMSAASCSTYEVVMILKKQREPLKSLEVVCTGKQESEPPNRFTHIHLHYTLKGDLTHKNVKKAIHLSEDKYCSVINTLKSSLKITSDFEIIE